LLDVAFGPDGGRIVTAGEDGTVRIWDTAAGTSPVPPLVHPGPVRAAAYSPDGRQLVTACEDGTARLWNADSGEQVREFKHEGPVNHATFSADGRFVVTASADHTARVWNAATGEPITPPLRHGSPVVHASFSPDSQRVITASDDNTARLWNASDGTALTPPLRHMGTVRRGVFSPGGQLVATASDDGTARIWDATTGEPITPLLKHRGPATGVAFDQHGTRLVTCGPFAARLWRLARDERPVDELVQAAQLLAVGRIDDTGGLIALSVDAVRDAWRDSRGKQPELGAPPKTEVMSWHNREVVECEMCGDWYGAAWHLERMLAARPSDARLLRLRGDARAGTGDWQRAMSDYTQAIENERTDWEAHLHRGLAYAQLRQWSQAAADFAQNRDLGPDDPGVWHFCALTQLAAGDMPAYRATCADLLKRFGNAVDVETARQVVWTAVLASKAVPDAERLLAEAERILKARPRHPLYLLTHGAALLRAGKLWEASEQLQAALADGGDHAAHALLLLTLTYQQTGKIDEAKPWFDRALEALDEANKEREEPHAWDRRLELEILRGEAERIFKQGKP
jgi:tetratricopeptide (TPR) repeat protein